MYENNLESFSILSKKKKKKKMSNLLTINRDRNATLTQNYRRLGLMHRLKAPTGGVEKRAPDDQEPDDSLHIKGSANAVTKQSFGETKVERDPETGKIMRVVHDDDDEIEVAGRKHRRSNPLEDPLNDLSSDEEQEQTRGTQQKNNGKKQNDSQIVRQLELQMMKEEDLVKKRKPRQQSTREGEWILGLVERHGDDYEAMARDMKLNPMQQTPGDLRRRIRKWKESQEQ